MHYCTEALRGRAPPDINSRQVFFHGSCSLCISIHCMCPVQSPALVSTCADSNQGTQSQFQRARVCWRSSKPVQLDICIQIYCLFWTLASSVEPQLIRQVQISQHELVIRLWEGTSLLQMGFCHISGIHLNIPWRCSSHDELPFNYNRLLSY